jgi:hypothetical protein
VGDASTLNLLESYFTQQHTFPAEIDPSFSGTFDLLFRESVGYSSRAQYLGEIRLTGNNNAELSGGSSNDTMFGNDGNNNLNGRSGDDVLDGGAGLDSAIYNAPFAEFTVTNNGDGSTTVQHNSNPGLGTDLVRNIEVLVFSDQTVQL